jgi:tRNA G18 (ribose-2'-O)-methylase SpoU
VNGPHAVASSEDPRIDVFRDVRDRDLRGRDGIFMAESELVVRRLLRTPERLHSLLLSPPRFEAMQDVLVNLPDALQVFVAPLPLMESIAGFHIHRGVLAAGLRPSTDDLALAPFIKALPATGPCVVLGAAGITNVDNMGGLFRVAAAFGAAGVVLDARCCDPLYRKAIRVSMGHTLSVPFAVADDLLLGMAALLDWGLPTWAMESDVEAVQLHHAPPPERAFVLVGNEGKGLSQDVRMAAHTVAEIPMAPGVPSLNVVCAASVALWERSRCLG